MSDQRPLVEVVAGILVAPDGQYLMASRPPGKVYAGYWEFPGGKIEPGESPRAALDRELQEELGVTPTRADPWLVRTFSYEHARVRIRFFRVTRWDGRPEPREGQQVAWQAPGPATLAPMLPANVPILRAIALPDRYGITAGGLVGEAQALVGLQAALRQGVRLIQIREKDFSPARLRQFVAQVLLHTRPAGAQVLLNGDPALALACGVDGVHLDSARLASCRQRPALTLVAASCHDRAGLERAEALGCDFAVWGSVLASASHPGQPGRGWDTFAAEVAGLDMPVYAIGGLGPEDLEQARAHGAQGIAAIRGLMVP